MDRHKTKLECPFTWIEVMNIDPDLFKDEKFLEHVNDELILSIMYLCMKTYFCTNKREYNKAREYLKKSEGLFNSLNPEQLKEEIISINVIKHIVESTKYYLDIEFDDNIDAIKAIDSLSDSKNFLSNEELATLVGCKSIALSFIFEVSRKTAISLIRQAISLEPKCPMWYYILGKNLRHCRRKETFNTPSNEEKEAFCKSYELLKNPFYGIHVAQMFREDRNYSKSSEIYLEIYNMKPTSVEIRLRLALGFIRKKDDLTGRTSAEDLHRAKVCLDYVERLRPTDSMFLTYKGFFMQKIGNLQVASKYFKEAASSITPNFAAAYQYGICMLLIDPKFNYVAYLNQLLEKFGNDEFYKQRLLLTIAFKYYKESNIKDSMHNFLKAIIVNPESKLLKKFFNRDSHTMLNIFDFIHNTILEDFKRRSWIVPADIRDTFDELQKLCNQGNLESS